MAEAHATYHADTTSLAKLQPSLDAVTAFSEAAEKNAALMDKVLDKVPDTTGTTFGAWVERGVATKFGSETMAEFATFRKSLQDEYARIVSNPNLTGVLSDSARKEMETILDKDSPVKAIRSALKALTKEAANRKTSYQDQLEAIKTRTRGGEAPKVKMSAEDLIKKYGGK